MQTWVTRTPAQQHSSIGAITGIYFGLNTLAVLAFLAACVQFTMFITPRISISYHALLAKALLK